jgi:Tol biopolymer transport system component/tRNA A-37 threonylcarbamoyl transferase component Bud32
MALSVGICIGGYEIIALIGKGGMGEVYRARDATLKREVALKVLPKAFAHDPERMARFQREAEVLASLNHPNIAHIYGVAESEKARALVMELVEGESPKGPLPFDDAWKIMLQVAGALEYAHDKNVIHRDLKPANVKVTPEGPSGGIVKLLDFGLARAFSPAPDSRSGDPENSPTLTMGATVAGTILGTAAYMSPEQAKGRPVDKRADIWSWGVVLYELLTGERLFKGEDTADTLAQVLTKEPDLTRVPVQTRRLLRRCLEKDPKQRLRDIGDARSLLQEPESGTESPAQAKGLPHAWIPWAMAALAVGVGLWGWLRPGPPRQSVPTARVATSLPIRNSPGGLAISRDGSRIAFVSASGAGQIYVRAMDQLEAKPIPGTEGAAFLCFSPDGEQIAFVQASSLLRKVGLVSGVVQSLATVGSRRGPPTLSWGDDGNILYSDDGVLTQIPAGGGKASVIAKPDSGNFERYYAGAHLLPGSRQILAYLRGGAKGSQTIALDPRDGAKKVLLPGGEFTQFIPAGASPTTGYLAYYDASTGALMAVPFDAERLEIRGEPVPVVEGISGYSNSPFPLMAISNSGTLLYVAGAVGQSSNLTLAWVDRNGTERAVGAPPKIYVSARVSPVDPNRIALNIAGEIWIYDDRRSTMDRITTSGLSGGPVWTPDGQRIVYERVPPGSPAVMSAPADRSGPPTVVAANANAKAPIAPSSISADGKLIFGYYPLEKGLWALPLNGGPNGGKPESILESDFAKSVPDISPDEHWIAYTADDTGRAEVYVSSYPQAGPKITISTDGGSRPRWSHNGRELFYMAGGSDGATTAIMAVDVLASPEFRASRPRKLFQGPYRTYDPAPDGQRFLVIKNPALTPQDTSSRQVTIVFNWFEDLRRRVPLPR